MNQEELFQKVKEMIKGGNFDGAKRFIEEHKEQLGPYKEKAQNLLKDVNIDSVKDKFKNLFNFWNTVCPEEGTVTRLLSQSLVFPESSLLK